MNFVLCAASILFLYLWWKWKIAAAVLAAWMAEKKYCTTRKRRLRAFTKVGGAEMAQR